MSEEVNVLLGQRRLPNGKLRVHWQVDQEGYPIKPVGSDYVDSSLQILPVEEEWLTGKKENFDGFTIPYYDYVYMKDMEVMDEVYTIQPFVNDIVVMDLTLDFESLYNKYSFIEGEEAEQIINSTLTGDEGIVTDFEVIAGFSKERYESYTEQEAKEMDLAVAFKDVWKEDMSKIAEAYTYATLVNKQSLYNAEADGNKKIWE